MEPVAFFYDADTAYAACETLKAENIFAEVLDGRIEPFGVFVTGNSGGFKIMVNGENLDKAEQVLVAHRDAIMRAGVKEHQPPTRSEKIQNRLWFIALVLVTFILFASGIRR